MTLNVHYLSELDSQIADYLSAQLDPAVRLTSGEKSAKSGDIHILVSGRPDRELLLANDDLKMLIVPWTGIPPETRDLLADFPRIALHNLHHNATPVAEMAAALLLAAAKNLIPMDQALRKGDWRLRYQKPAPSLTLNNRTALILGYGEIGRRVARICKSMGMNVIATRRSAAPGDSDEIADEIYPPQKLNDLLPRAQTLIVALPLTPETEGLIGDRELALLPPESVLVNIGRARIVDEEALFKALKNRALGAAGLDVWYSYPEDEQSRASTFPAEYPFWELENVVMSPHRAGLTREIEHLRMDHLAVLLNAVARNERVSNLVDINLGY
jgi:phosphoglycerate dehydrogenase-like enzyme